jgi:hypothetical protein
VVGLWILVALLGLGLFVALLPVELAGRLHTEGLTGRVEYRVRVGPLTLAGTKPLDELARRVLKARKAKRQLPAFLPQRPQELLEWGRPAIDYFRRRIRFRRLNLFVEIGGLDAFESAMLAGLVWTVAGTLGGILSQIFPLPPGLYQVTVQPNWQEPALGLNLDCMLTFRVGHAIRAGVLLVPQALKSAQAAAARRRRQKGEEAHG